MAVSLLWAVYLPLLIFQETKYPVTPAVKLPSAACSFLQPSRETKPCLHTYSIPGLQYIRFRISLSTFGVFCRFSYCKVTIVSVWRKMLYRIFSFEKNSVHLFHWDIYSSIVVCPLDMEVLFQISLNNSPPTLPFLPQVSFAKIIFF